MRFILFASLLLSLTTNAHGYLDGACGMMLLAHKKTIQEHFDTPENATAFVPEMFSRLISLQGIPEEMPDANQLREANLKEGFQPSDLEEHPLLDLFLPETLRNASAITENYIPEMGPTFHRPFFFATTQPAKIHSWFAHFVGRPHTAPHSVTTVHSFNPSRLNLIVTTASLFPGIVMQLLAGELMFGNHQTDSAELHTLKTLGTVAAGVGGFLGAYYGGHYWLRHSTVVSRHVSPQVVTFPTFTEQFTHLKEAVLRAGQLLSGDSDPRHHYVYWTGVANNTAVGFLLFKDGNEEVKFVAFYHPALLQNP